MSNKTIRMIIMLGAFVIVGIFTVQLYWLQKTFSIQDKQFEQSVRINLSNVSQAVNEGKAGEELGFRSVEQLSSNYYLLHVNGKIDTSLLNNLLKKEFLSGNYKFDAEYAIYDSITHQIVYGNFITGRNLQSELKGKDLPSFQNGDYYIGISFPGILFRMTGEMYVWIFSTFVMLIFLVFFAYALFVILRQKRLSEVQRDFVNNMTHEFKTPLSTISLAAETLGSYPENRDPQLYAFLNIIKEESSKLNSQVDKILLMGRSKSLELNLKKEELDLHDLIKEVGENVKSSFRKSIKLTYDLNAQSPIINADRTCFIHALQNLLDNAVKYSGNNPEVIVSTIDKNGRLLLSVADNGIGIDTKYQNKIFDPFFRIPSDNLHNVRGFGIGLHYVKNIVNAHRWKLSLISQQDKGSKFTLQIPA